MRRIRLTTTEQAYLAHLFKTTPDRRLRDRCQAVLMARRGRKRKTIAQDLGGQRMAMRVFCQRHTIRPSRPTYRYLRGAPEQHQAARFCLEQAGGSVGIPFDEIRDAVRFDAHRLVDHAAAHGLGASAVPSPCATTAGMRNV